MLPAPNPDYRANYDQYGGAGFWRNMNMTPDFPSAARAVLNAYEEYSGERLDGVISADPFALQGAARGDGTARVPGLNRKIDADNVVAFTTNEAYIRYGATPRCARRSWVTSPRECSRPSCRWTSTTPAGCAAGRLGRQRTPQALRRHRRVAGGRTGAGQVRRGVAQRRGTDVSAVIVNSGSGNKVDFYASRTSTTTCNSPTRAKRSRRPKCGSRTPPPRRGCPAT